jgi:uncharacterized cupredoxin-like copper-binding protein
LFQFGQGDHRGVGQHHEVYPNLEPGEYAFYCGVDGHRAQGMEGTLTVE